MASELRWPDYYPENCPPEDAQPASGVVYRFCRGREPRPADFYPHHIRFPNMEFHDLCQSGCGISVYRTPGDIEIAARLVPGMDKKVPAVGSLAAEHGVTKPTPQEDRPTHTTWWIPVGIDAHELFQACDQST